MVFALAASILQISTPKEIPIVEALGMATPGGRRTPIQIDPVQKLIVEGLWKAPSAGEKIGASEWTAQKANADGTFTGGATRGGYLFAKIDSPNARTMLLEASGASVAYVNGAPRGGDPYQYGYLSLPIELKQGENHFLFVAGRGSFRAKLVEPAKTVSWDPRDATLPDQREGAKGSNWAAIVVRNATQADLTGTSVEAVSATGKELRSPGWRVPAMSIRKVGFRIPAGDDTKWTIRLLKDAQELDAVPIELRKRTRTQSYKRTFVSAIDGSVQYFGVMPSSKPAAGQSLVLSLHGASVEAMGQADAYGQKDWAHIVAPTNRRPFGFDWEEIGRLDALEVLEIARNDLKTDPAKTYLTGHSMGGHGTWQIGAHYPGRFAAVGPSAGWISFQTYAGGVRYENPTPVESILERAMSPSLTLLLKDNYWNQAVYILHGDADDNVPVGQARQMRQELQGHPDVQWHEQAGAGHWWDASDAPGADCVDWKPMFDLFRERRIPAKKDVRRVRFTTVSPSISANLHWATIDQQVEPFWTTSVDLKADPANRKISGTTVNVRTLALELGWMPGSGAVTVELDSQSVQITLRNGKATLINEGGVWVTGSSRKPSEKGALRGGGFKSVFNHGVVFVYGTMGNAEENAWARNKARYDAETLYYRGNGSPEVVSDKEFLISRFAGRNVVLYGHSQSNAAWGAVVEPDRFSLQRNLAEFGEHSLTGDLAAMVLVPRRGSNDRVVGIVGGTSLAGMRLCDRMPFFTSGAGFPDVLVLRPSMLAEGTKGVALAGYFGNDWEAESGWWAAQP